MIPRINTKYNAETQPKEYLTDLVTSRLEWLNLGDRGYLINQEGKLAWQSTKSLKLLISSELTMLVEQGIDDYHISIEQNQDVMNTQVIQFVVKVKSGEDEVTLGHSIAL